jgi:hypothetical protein
MCFSLPFIEHFLIWLVWVVAFITVLKLLLPRILGRFGDAGTLAIQIIDVIVWAVILVAIIYVAFTVLNCLLIPR